ncbi:hypothetical protein MTR_8g464360 [Medicago truncatula]|uniref:Uncharacterized protein n=1 Tax=Medicago truncatula TaxID=3880 RepID=A0A072TRV4_MEDTR|nr:hypothetical protein MTR_8g464360 [Medicago truncatula]
MHICVELDYDDVILTPSDFDRLPVCMVGRRCAGLVALKYGITKGGKARFQAMRRFPFSGKCGTSRPKRLFEWLVAWPFTLNKLLKKPRPSLFNKKVWTGKACRRLGHRPL